MGNEKKITGFRLLIVWLLLFTGAWLGVIGLVYGLNAFIRFIINA